MTIMAKCSPSFDFYPNDFLAGTRLLEVDEIGAYVLLLCHQWQYGHIPETDRLRMRAAMVTSEDEWCRIWESIRDKFTYVDTDSIIGLDPSTENHHVFVNERMHRDRNKRVRIYRQRIQNLSSANSARINRNTDMGPDVGADMGPDMGPDVEPHSWKMEDGYTGMTRSERSDATPPSGGNASEPPPEPPTPKRTRPPKPGSNIPPDRDEVAAFCRSQSLAVDPEAFCDHFDSNGWKVGGKTRMKNWQAAVRNWARRNDETSKPKKDRGPLL